MDVFLSHSGKQKDFVRQLYKDLTTDGVTCFFDESPQCLPLAEEWPSRIIVAAKTCRVAVLLLSEDFVRSKWPMTELAAFREAKNGENSELKILPLFYNIFPKDLPILTSNTQNIPDWTRPEITEETRNQWKDALKEVRKFNGLRFKKGEDKVSFRDQIIKKIRALLPPPPIVSMPVGSVGLEKRQEEVIKLLQLTSIDKPPMAVVIYGFGGIGKTTLAEAVVAKIDLKSYHYARVDFHIDSSRNDMKIMQEQILNGLFAGKKRKLRSCSEGRTVLTQTFQREGSKSIFLFIDNALRKQELDELLPRDMKGLPKGSRILVTTRNLSATDMFIEVEAGVERQQYLVQPLSDQAARDFLLKNRADCELENIQEKDVKRILNICKGVPLVLKIVRGHIRKQGYRADKCSQILEALERGEQINQEDLGRTLTDFVYVQLEESTKQAFLDICCFLYDMAPSHVEYIVGAQELTSLEESAFVQRSDDKETLIVHDIIRERGRNKAGLESKELESMRITNVDSLIDATNQQRLKDIRGVWLDDKDGREDELEEKHLKAMRKLRILVLRNRMRVSEQCKVTFQELRYLEVHDDIPCLPLNLGRLPKLAFYVGPLFKIGFGIDKLPKELRVLTARGQSDFDKSTNSDLKDLQTVPQGLPLSNSLERMEVLLEEVCQLTMLTELSLSNCTSLTYLPAGFGRLKALKGLNLSFCRALECLPESIGELKALKDLDLCSCDALKRVPESFGQLKALVSLDLQCCKALQRLPESFVELKALKDLQLSNCTALARLPESFGELKALKDLQLSDCTDLERLPESFGQLEALELLKLSRCKALECLPQKFGELKSLKDLQLSNCSALERLPESFGQLKALKDLNMAFCKALESLPKSFGKLEALKTLDLSGCQALKRLPEPFGQLADLKKLDLSNCPSLQCLPESFGDLKALEDLILESCKSLERLPESFGQFAAVEKLRLSYCRALQSLPESLWKLKTLQNLDLNGCKALGRLPESFGQLIVLKTLGLRYCTALECLPESFGQLKALKDLKLSQCTALKHLPESFGELKALIRLDLSHCNSLEHLPESFGQLTSLRDLMMVDCGAREDLRQFEANLQHVKIYED